MPRATAPPARPPSNSTPAIPNGTTRVRVAALKPLEILDVFARVAPGAEPDRAELIRQLKAGAQPYPVVAAGDVVLFARELLLAARAAGVESVDVCGCVVGGTLLKADFGLKAAGLHLRAVLSRQPLDPFDIRLLGATVYEALTANSKRCRLRGVSREQKEERPAQRQALITREFGRAQRSLERDVVLRHLPPGLRDAVRRGQLPERFIEAAAKLEAKDQKDLATLLASGTKFAGLEVQFFGASSRQRKTDRGAFHAIRASIHALAEEARGRADRFPLEAEDRPAAREAIECLSRWLASPVPELTPEDVEEVTEEVGEYPRGGHGGASAATRGGRSAKGGAA